MRASTISPTISAPSSNLRWGISARRICRSARGCWSIRWRPRCRRFTRDTPELRPQDPLRYARGPRREISAGDQRARVTRRRRARYCSTATRRRPRPTALRDCPGAPPVSPRRISRHTPRHTSRRFSSRARRVELRRHSHRLRRAERRARAVGATAPHRAVKRLRTSHNVARRAAQSPCRPRASLARRPPWPVRRTPVSNPVPSPLPLHQQLQK